MKTSLYETDFYQWTLEQASLLRGKKFTDVDIENLIEEIETLGRSEKRAIKSHLRVLLLHMLKLNYQSIFKTNSWNISMRNSKKGVLERVMENPSLKPKLSEILDKSYKEARHEASVETSMDEREFPKECPWTIEEILQE